MKSSKKDTPTVPTIFIVLGITGDLAARKIIPALDTLAQNSLLPSRLELVGVSRGTFTPVAFKDHLRALVPHKDKSGSAELPFIKNSTHVAGNLNDPQVYIDLKKALDAIDAKHGICSNKLFYLAVYPELYEPVLTNLASSGLTEPCDPDEGWTHVIIEKPFGKDLSTARKLDTLITKLFDETQIYRIDHYLAKEMLQNIMTLRFSNPLFGKLWDVGAIDSIHIRLFESLGVEKRGAFYDSVGALRDVGQNHLLQMLALGTMREPKDMGAESVRDRRAEILEKLVRPSIPSIRKNSVRGQYKGYKSIEGVKKGSTTETYFKVQASLDDKRLKDTVITLEGGKRLGQMLKEMVVTFRQKGSELKNRIVFALEPEEKITIHLWAKKLGLGMELEERTFEFLLRDANTKPQYTEEYARLLLDCIRGDQTLFIRSDEIEAMWRFIDPIVREWSRNRMPLITYEPDKSL